jgi:hypothetical protein
MVFDLMKNGVLMKDVVVQQDDVLQQDRSSLNEHQS